MIFIDTGAFFARAYKPDGFHAHAVAAWKELETQGLPLFTSNLVLAETFTLMGRKANYEYAAEQAREILDSKSLTILRPDKADEREALSLFRKFADQRVSFTDCVSFALMKRHRIRRAFAFDVHFAYAGFLLWPGRA
ncbi:MAG: PIN domain-containing protein [Planctomycetota bacterium]